MVAMVIDNESKNEDHTVHHNDQDKSDTVNREKARLTLKTKAYYTKNLGSRLDQERLQNARDEGAPRLPNLGSSGILRKDSVVLKHWSNSI